MKVVYKTIMERIESIIEGAEEDDMEISKIILTAYQMQAFEREVDQKCPVVRGENRRRV